MPRLRKIINSRYIFRDDDSNFYHLIDESEQEKIIDKFNESLPFSRMRSINIKDVKLIRFLKLWQFLFLIANLLLIILPYYRKQNAILSSLSCLSILSSTLLIQVELILHDSKRQILMGVMENATLSTCNVATSSIIGLLTLWKFNQSLDVIFFLPFLISLTVHISITDLQNLNERIKELNKLKYSYKEA